MPKNRKGKKIFNGLDIGLMTVVGIIAFGTLVFSATLIWLLSTI